MPDLDRFRRWQADVDGSAVSFGARVRETRRALGCSQATFGRRVGLHQSTISRLERGLLPSLTFAKAIRLLAIVLDTQLRSSRGGG